MQQCISQHDALLTGDGPSVLSTAAPVARPQDWEIRIFQGDASSSQPVSREECAAMITEALQQKVGPALQAAFSQVGAELVNRAVKINTLEHEVRVLKIRTAWTEKDLMYSQIEAAKRTLVVRNFLEWATAADRELTVAEALMENNLGYLEWDLTTTQMEGTFGKKFLAPISILTVPTYSARKKVMDACSRAVVRYWHEVKDEAGHEKEDETGAAAKKMAGGADGGREECQLTGPGEGKQRRPKGRRHRRRVQGRDLTEGLGDQDVELEPSSSDGARHHAVRAPSWCAASWLDERVPEALRPFQEGDPGAEGGRLSSWRTRRGHGWEESFAAAKPRASQELRAQWRTGSVRSSCRQSTRTASWSAGVTSDLTDGGGEGGLLHSLTEDQPGLLAAARLNRFLTKAVPTYNEGEEHGIENWVARSSNPGSSLSQRSHRTTRTASSSKSYAQSTS